MNARETRGQEIAEKQGQISRVTDYYYTVRSQTETRKLYYVERKSFGWVCTCPDFVYRKVKCKHVFAVEISISLRKVVEFKKIEPISPNITSCLFCKSGQIVKQGLRRNKSGDIQKFGCKTCGKYFTVNIGFERMKHNPQAITSAMQLYFSGESLRNVTKSLRLLGVDVVHSTVYKWIGKYTELMTSYLDKITPQVSGTWRADEIYVKVKGNPKYLFALMDDETRFWISQQVADTKGTSDIRPLFKNGSEYTGKKPQVLITDGAPNFHDAFNKEYYAHETPRSIHIQDINFENRERHNNKMERMNGEIRDREKTMRGIKKDETPILKGYQIFHNFIREHQGLNGQTPADKAGIVVTGKNKWRTLIQNASIGKL